MYAQYKHTKYLHGYSALKKQPSNKTYEQTKEGKQLKPAVAHETVRIFFTDYGIKFDWQKCDLCIACHQPLHSALQDFPRDDPWYFKFEQELLKQQVEAQQGIKLQWQQEQAAKHSHGMKEVLQMDMITNPRMLMTKNDSEAFYK